MKKIVFILIFIFSIFLLVGCSSGNDRGNMDYPNESAPLTEEHEVSSPNRKLIYKVRLTISSNQINEVINKAKLNLNNDEWLDSEIIQTNYATLVIRVKTDRLDQYLASITKDEKSGNFEKQATDVSSLYQNIETQIESLELQIDRLLKLYEKASVSEMIAINQQLSNAQSNLKRLQGELTNFDSLVEYSTITLHITQNKQDIKEEGFFEDIKNAFLEGFNFLLNVFKGLLVVIVFLIPISIILVPSIYGISRLIKKRRIKKQSK